MFHARQSRVGCRLAKCDTSQMANLSVCQGLHNLGAAPALLLVFDTVLDSRAAGPRLLLSEFHDAGGGAVPGIRADVVRTEQLLTQLRNNDKTYEITRELLATNCG